MGRHSLLPCALALLPAAPFCVGLQQPAAQDARTPPGFELPCTDYLRGLRGSGPQGRGNFGVLVTAKDSPFAGTYHLGEDVWLPAGTAVRSVAAGTVRYSDFSPTWTDTGGHVHWNLGNVIVVEHPLDPPVDGLAAVCSFYVHLGADRRVAVGDSVARGQLIGAIGKDRSEENGRYAAHLHLGLHRGPYLQIPPAWRRELEETARTTGIVIPNENPIRGEIELTMASQDSVLVRARDGGARVLLSLLVGSTAPGRKPADIMAWCSGYGDRNAVDEWLCPSTWIAAHAAPASRPASAPASRPRR